MRAIESFIGEDICIGENDNCAMGIRSGFLIVWLISVTIDLMQFNEKSEQKPTTKKPARPTRMTLGEVEGQMPEEAQKKVDEFKFVPSGDAYHCAIM